MLLSNHALLAEYSSQSCVHIPRECRLFKARSAIGEEAFLMLVIELHGYCLSADDQDAIVSLQSFVNSNPTFLPLIKLSLEEGQLLAIQPWADRPVGHQRLVHDIQQARLLLIRLVELHCAAQESFDIDCFFPENTCWSGSQWRVGSLSALAHMVAQQMDSFSSQAPEPLAAIAGTLVQLANNQPIEIGYGFRLQRRHLPLADDELLALVDGLISGAIIDPKAVLNQLDPTSLSSRPADRRTSLDLVLAEQSAAKPQVNANDSAPVGVHPTEVLPFIQLPVPPQQVDRPVIHFSHSIAIHTDRYPGVKADHKAEAASEHTKQSLETIVTPKVFEPSIKSNHPVLYAVVRELRTNFGSNWHYFNQPDRFSGMKLITSADSSDPPCFERDGTRNPLYLACELDECFGSSLLVFPNYGLSFFERFINHIHCSQRSPHACVYDFQSGTCTGRAYTLNKPAFLKIGPQRQFTIVSKGLITIKTSS